MKWVSDWVAYVLWTIGLVTIMVAVVAAILVEHNIAEVTDSQFGYAFLVLALIGMGIALMGTGLLLLFTARRRPPRR